MVPTNSSSFQTHEQNMKDILLRSGRALLSLSLTSVYNFNPDELRVLVPHFPRLRELNVVGISGGLFSILPSSLPFLEKVSVSRIFGFGTSTFSLEEAPRLREATFTSCSLSSLPFMLPLSQIAIIAFPNLSLDPVDVLRLLVQCHSLVECRLHINNPVRANPDMVQNRLNLPQTHTIPFLSFFHLELEWNFNDQFVDLRDFQILSLPHLSHFELDGTARSFEWFRAILSSGTSLEILHLSNFSGGEDEMRLILESAPSLRTLKVDVATFQKVIKTRGLLDLLPKLETLHLPLPWATSLLDIRMVNLTADALDQRRAESCLPTRIPRLVFQASEHTSASTFPRLETMKEAGWEIDIIMQTSG